MVVGPDETPMSLGMQSPPPRLRPAEEGRLVAGLARSADASKKEGDDFYLISRTWYRHWQAYTMEEPEEMEEEEEKEGGKREPFGSSNLSDRSSGGGGGSIGGMVRPPAIDNLPLLKDGELNDELQEGVDFEVIAEAAWKKLHEIYGGGPAIRRSVISLGPLGGLAVELHPLRLLLLLAGSSRKQLMTISRKATVGDLLARVSQQMELSGTEVRLWDNFGGKRQRLLADSSEQLEEAGIQMDNEILVELPDNNGSWLLQSPEGEEEYDEDLLMTDTAEHLTPPASSPSGSSAPSHHPPNFAQVSNFTPNSLKLALVPVNDPAPSSNPFMPAGIVTSIAGGPLSDYSPLPAAASSIFPPATPPSGEAAAAAAGVGEFSGNWSPVRSDTDYQSAESDERGGDDDPLDSMVAAAAGTSQQFSSSSAGPGSSGGVSAAGMGREEGGGGSSGSGGGKTGFLSMGMGRMFGKGKQAEGSHAAAAADGGSRGGVLGLGIGKEPPKEQGAVAAVTVAKRGSGLLGLVNLGNTCFMNSALQCLVHTPALVDFFLGGFEKELNKSNPLGMGGELACAFGELVRKLWSPGREAVAPRIFKAKLGRFAPQFSGYQQHDSQELLAFLLDGLHEDLNRVFRKPYIEAKDADGRPDDDVANEYWANHKARNDSVIVDTCQGQFKSTLVCPVCSKISVTFDPFMYLSLPLPSKQTKSIHVMLIDPSGSRRPEPHVLQVNKNGKVEDLMRALKEAAGIRAQDMLHIVEVYKNVIYKTLLPSEPLEKIASNDKLAAFRLPATCQQPLPAVQRTMQASILGSKDWSPFASPFLFDVSAAKSGAHLYSLVFNSLRPFLKPGAPEVTAEDLLAMIRQRRGEPKKEQEPALLSREGQSADGTETFAGVSEPRESQGELLQQQEQDAEGVSAAMNGRGSEGEGQIGVQSDLADVTPDGSGGLEARSDDKNTMDLVEISPTLNRAREEGAGETMESQDALGGTTRSLPDDGAVATAAAGAATAAASAAAVAGNGRREAEGNEEAASLEADAEDLSSQAAAAAPSGSGQAKEAREEDEEEALRAKDLHKNLKNPFPFRLWISIETGAYKEKIEPIEPWEDAKLPEAVSAKNFLGGKRSLLLDWSANQLANYDLRFLQNLPEVGAGDVLTRSKKSEPVSLYSCLDAFLKEEPLGPDDMWYCPGCKEHRQANKKLDLWRLPEILVVHLKRFSYSRWMKSKIETLVDFPVRDLDLSNHVPETRAKVLEHELLQYDLYAISNHYGGMGGGHYTAYVKVHEDGRWHNFDDSFVSPTNEEQILTTAAYVLFYRRKGSQHDGRKSMEVEEDEKMEDAE